MVILSFTPATTQATVTDGQQVNGLPVFTLTGNSVQLPPTQQQKVYVIVKPNDPERSLMVHLPAMAQGKQYTVYVDGSTAGVHFIPPPNSGNMVVNSTFYGAIRGGQSYEVTFANGSYYISK